MREHAIGLLLIAVVALGAMTGVAAAEGDLGVTVDGADEDPTVTVTENDTAVENATVSVSVVDPADESYAGTGTYETDTNGTVDLDAPAEDVTVDVTAEYENASVTETVDLTAADEAAAESRPFGQLVRDLVDRVRNGEGGVGAAVSDFVTENNPGNAPDHAGSPGGPDDAANGSDAANASEAPGNAPDHAGPSDENDSERGPPDHAGPGGDDDANDGDDAAKENDDDAAEENDSDDADDADDGSTGNGSSNGNAPGN